MFFPEKENKKSPWHYRKTNESEFRGYDNSDREIISDVLGSYTGTPFDGARPIQDADDL
jgi:hypothetical protein